MQNESKNTKNVTSKDIDQQEQGTPENELTENLDEIAAENRLNPHQPAARGAQSNQQDIGETADTERDLQSGSTDMQSRPRSQRQRETGSDMNPQYGGRHTDEQGMNLGPDEDEANQDDEQEKAQHREKGKDHSKGCSC